MINIGDCYFSKKIEHLVIAVGKNDNKILIVSITSNSFDKSCKLEVDDIIDNMGNQILKHTSYVGYRFSFEFEGFGTFEAFRKIYDFRCNISNELLSKIKEGGRVSHHLQHRFKKYFL
ncbi:MAG: hypothetical protein LBH46_01685 [Rickettsiales bacterium]|jgi:hypothetical protein|nr:hypothetical protein [Rickettsiales bacterium]